MVNGTGTEPTAREIELELIRVRAAAEAARLDARAAELELILRRMMRGETVAVATAAIGKDFPLPRDSNAMSVPMASVANGSSPEAAAVLPPMATIASTPVKTVENNIWRSDSESWPTAEPPPEAIGWIDRMARFEARVDPPKAAIPAPHLPMPVAESIAIASPPVADNLDEPPKAADPVKVEAAPQVAADPMSDWIAIAAATPVPTKPAVAMSLVELAPLANVESQNDDEEEQSLVRRFRPASWLVSTLAHVAVLMMLGVFTLSNVPPKDQLAFTASASSSEESMETFEIQSSEPVEDTQPAVSEVAYEVSDVGTMSIAEVVMDVPAAASPAMSVFLSSASSSMSSSMMKALKGDSDSKMQFCGVEGGGNHFVYLVDSSGSMKDGFQSARNELLGSIDQLKPDQRFYVVFFDEQPEFMRITDPNQDEPGSVMATPENKARLRSWAMTVAMDRGKAPYDVLPFAIKLRPDVIFLLSDGEFPTKIEEILREQNREENLFGESGPISIVHTIRYHGEEGETGRNAEATMIAIAKDNGGQYRHVPKPNSIRRQ